MSKTNSYTYPEIDLKYLKGLVIENECHLDAESRTDIELPFNIQPRDFLNYAEYDLNNNYNHHLINSYSNIKRAIDCQLDSLLVGFGLFENSKKEKWKFPTKIDYLNKLDVISPRILKKINQKRNLLEHEYIKPNIDDVEDALDVATLFINYTEKFLINAIIQCVPFNDNTGETIVTALDYKNNKIIFSEHMSREKILKIIDADSADYFEYIKWYISLYKIR
jgi:hypothetical protein